MPSIHVAIPDPDHIVRMDDVLPASGNDRNRRGDPCIRPRSAELAGREDAVGDLEASHRVPLSHSRNDVGRDDIGPGRDMHGKVIGPASHRAMDRPRVDPLGRGLGRRHERSTLCASLPSRAESDGDSLLLGATRGDKLADVAADGLLRLSLGEGHDHVPAK